MLNTEDHVGGKIVDPARSWQETERVAIQNEVLVWYVFPSLVKLLKAIVFITPLLRNRRIRQGACGPRYSPKGDAYQLDEGLGCHTAQPAGSLFH